VSENSRTGFWGKGAIEQISSLLQKELPGLRGFSATSIRNMRIFYEEWDKVLNHPPLADDLVLNEKLLLVEIHQPVADEFNWSDFFSIGFSHHTEIISKAKTLEARLFYIHECAIRYWSKYTLTFSTIFSSKSSSCSFSSSTLMKSSKYSSLNEQTAFSACLVSGNVCAKLLDFSFIGNQYRMEVAGEEMFIDLLFFNRELNSLVAVELKSGKFRYILFGAVEYLSIRFRYIYQKTARKPFYRNNSLQRNEQTFVEFAVRDYNKPMGVATFVHLKICRNDFVTLCQTLKI